MDNSFILIDQTALLRNDNTITISTCDTKCAIDRNSAAYGVLFTCYLVLECMQNPHELCGVSQLDVFYNKLYYFHGFLKSYFDTDGIDYGIEQQELQIVEYAEVDYDPEIVANIISS